MSEYTPTTDEMRAAYQEAFTYPDREILGEQFDCWLAEVERVAAAQALEEAADEIFVQHAEFGPFERMAFNRGADAVYDALRARAAKIRENS